MYKLVGTRLNSNIINKTYDDVRIALFEFDVTKLVAKELTLYENDTIIDRYEVEIKNKTTYILIGETVFGEINKEFDDEKIALKEYSSNKDRSNWLSLYKKEDDNMEQMKIFVNDKIA